MEKEQELLSNYIQDVLYHPERAKLELSALTGEYQTLGRQIKQLSEWALQAERYAGAVARGEAAGAAQPDPDNVFAQSILALQRTLRYMTDEVQQLVDRGREDNGQTALAGQDFDDVVRELRRRTSALENERNLFIQFTESASERIVVLDEETGEMLFANKVARAFREQTTGYVDEADVLNRKSGCSMDTPYSQWLHTVVHPGENGEPITEYFQVHSIYILWENRGAIAHMFSNVTEFHRVHDLAMKDALTGVFSRGYSMDYLDRLYAQGRPFSVAFVDVDHLKYCNDTFGHRAGDDYLQQVTGLLQSLRCEMVCRTGGDEFLVVSEALSQEALAEKLEQARQSLYQERFEDKARSIRKSFSYGVASRAEDYPSLHALLGRADERMYQNKLENKRHNHLLLQDDRLPQ